MYLFDNVTSCGDMQLNTVFRGSMINDSLVRRPDKQDNNQLNQSGVPSIHQSSLHQFTAAQLHTDVKVEHIWKNSFGPVLFVRDCIQTQMTQNTFRI